MRTTTAGSSAEDGALDWFETPLGGAAEILIAEDDEVARRVLEATLCSYGFKVIATSNGAEACRALEAAESPPLAILDLMMPDMDGLEVCKWIRASAKLRHTYVILLTIRSSANDIATGLYLGADDYIVKPYDRAELRARIQVGLRVLALRKELVARVCANCGSPLFTAAELHKPSNEELGVED